MAPRKRSRNSRPLEPTSEQSDDAEATPVLPKLEKAPERLGSPFADLASRVKLPPKPKPAPKKPARPAAPAARPSKAGGESPVAPIRRSPAHPLADYSYDDRAAFQAAFGDVRPLGAPAQGSKPKKRGAKPPGTKKVMSGPDPAELQARATLDRLVGGGARFKVRRNEDGGLEGWRDGVPGRTLRMLAGGELAPEDRLDLHGHRVAEANALINGFIRKAHRAGRRTLVIIHGKGQNSEGGRGVLETATVDALTEGGAAPLVEAFTTAPMRFGGHGATVVRLRSRL